MKTTHAYPFDQFRQGATLVESAFHTSLTFRFPGSSQAGLLARTKQLFTSEPAKQAWLKDVYESWKYNELFH